MNRLSSLLLLAAWLAGFANAQTFPVTVTVPGDANPFLAGQPDGVSTKSDTAPDQSPVMASPVFPGDVLTFSVTGSVNFGGGAPTSPPDGSTPFASASARGIAGYVARTLPINTLVGVFLSDAVPADPAPDEIVYPAEDLAYTLLAPQLHQIFYIGDGLTGNGEGAPQEIVVPTGATRLFLGSTDGFGWFNNSGMFEVVISRIRQAGGGPRVGPATIHFDQAAYSIAAGEPAAGSILIDPLPLGGLYSHGMVVTVRDREGMLAGVVTPEPIPVLDFHGVLLGAEGALSAGTGTGGLKGSSRFSEARETLTATTLGTFSIADLPPGIYDLTLQPWNELGPTEDIFVTGFSETLDDFITFEPATVEVIGAVLPEIDVQGPIVLQNQTGLLEQRLTLTNNTGRVLNGFRLFVAGLPAGVILWNAHGEIDGVPYVDIFGEIAAGESIDILLEYYRPSRDPAFEPDFQIAAAGGEPPAGEEGSILNLDLRIVRKDGLGVLVEFLTEKDQRYVIQYSDDMMSWRTSTPVVTGTGERIQWIDGGPPKTLSFPSADRYYRLAEEQE